MPLHAILGERGQLTIPPALRRALGLKTGDRVSFEAAQDGVWVIRTRTDAGAGGLSEIEAAAAESARKRALTRAAQAVSALAALRGGVEPFDGVPER